MPATQSGAPTIIPPPGVLDLIVAEELGMQAVSKLRESPASVGELEFHQLDVSDPASVSAFSQWLKQSHGGLNILVNNAGEGKYGSPAQQLRHLDGTLCVQVCAFV